MARWKETVKLKHLFTEDEDHESISASMRTIADEIKKHKCFNLFKTKHFYSIPKGDGIFSPCEYANKLLQKMYDYADDNGIWIE